MNITIPMKYNMSNIYWHSGQKRIFSQPPCVTSFSYYRLPRGYRFLI